MKYTSKSPKQTEQLGLKLAKKLKGGQILCLVGNLGSGKTCFVRGLARGLGIKQLITSPSFVFLKAFPVSNNRKIKYLVHLDCYRLKNKDKIDNIIPLEYFGKKDILVVIEWPERIKSKLPTRTQYIKFKILNNQQRKIII